MNRKKGKPHLLPEFLDMFDALEKAIQKEFK